MLFHSGMSEAPFPPDRLTRSKDEKGYLHPERYICPFFEASDIQKCIY